MIPALLVFLAATCADFFWSRYILHAAQGNRWRAAVWSTGIYLVAAFTVVEYTHNHWLIGAAAAGAFVGTLIGVKKP